MFLRLFSSQRALNFLLSSLGHNTNDSQFYIHLVQEKESGRIKIQHTPGAELKNNRAGIYGGNLKN
jgi:hypothetical protein